MVDFLVFSLNSQNSRYKFSVLQNRFNQMRIVVIEQSTVLFSSISIFLNVIQLLVIVVQSRVKKVSEWKAVHGETCSFHLQFEINIFNVHSSCAMII